VLVVSQQASALNSRRSRLWLVEVDRLEARELLAIPSDVVPGSALWSPDGRRVVFTARSGTLSALCVLDVGGAFRYLADLDPAPGGPPLPYPPATWSADGQQLAFVAPPPRPTGAPTSWLQPEIPRAVYTAILPDVVPTQVQETTADFVSWREDGQLLGLGRQGPDGALEMRLLSGNGGQHLVNLGLRPSASYAASWDLAHAQVIIANRAADGTVDFWLARLGLETDG
jgi:hypothetical protein